MNHRLLLPVLVPLAGALAALVGERAGPRLERAVGAIATLALLPVAAVLFGVAAEGRVIAYNQRSATASRPSGRMKNGDIVNIDVTVITTDGWHGDNSPMFVVGEGSIAARRLCAMTFEAMWKGIAKVRPGARLGDIGHAIQQFAENAGFSVVREFCGHGIGKRFHEESPRSCTTVGHAPVCDSSPG